MKRFIRGIAAALLCVPVPLVANQQSDELALTRRLADAGAPRLVLDRVVGLQPRDGGAPGWSEWESLRCAALAALDARSALVERAAALPHDKPAAVLSVCYTGAASAALALSRPAEARRYAASALWLFTLPPAQVQAMRRVVIDSYVAERRGDEAYRAMLRYQQDHRPLPREVIGAFVDGLLECGMDKEALAWLAQLDDAQPAKLRLRLRAGLVPRDTAVAQARAALAKGGDRGYWRVLLDAAGDDPASQLRLAAYEHDLDVAQDVPESVKAAALRLWDAYLAAATATANRAGLLVGDDASWADYAGRRFGSDPQLARALFAHLAQRAHTTATRYNAQLQLLHAYESERLERVGLRVFASLFSDIDSLDTHLRYRLGAMAEAKGQHADATRSWKDLPPPADGDAGAWLLRVARSRWLAGSKEPGVDAIARYYAERQALAPAALQVGMRYAEELIERGQHASAQRLLETLLPHVQPAQSAPLLYALARARERSGELVLAAQAYLRVALAATDAAAVEARLHAGVALARAGYAYDARRQLQWVIDNGRNAALADAARAELKNLQP